MFVQELEKWGPTAPAREVSRAEAERYCRDLATTHYENFPVVSYLLPRDLHQHFYNVYAYCRWADDLGDEIPETDRSLELLAWWRRLLDECYAGRATHPVFVALQGTIDEFDIPRQPFADLISAFEQDQRVLVYETFEQLRDYCRRSADSVGRLVLYLCRCFNEQNAEYSDGICTGLQLANFWQDVARDYEMGRVYLPRDNRLRFGYTDEMLTRRESTPEFRRLLEFEVERAADFLNSGRPLIANMPGRLQIDIDLFYRGGMKILQKIAQLDFAVWEKRPVVTKADGLAMLAAGCAAAARRRIFGVSTPNTNDPAHKPSVTP